MQPAVIPTTWKLPNACFQQLRYTAEPVLGGLTH